MIEVKKNDSVNQDASLFLISLLFMICWMIGISTQHESDQACRMDRSLFSVSCSLACLLLDHSYDHTTNLSVDRQIDRQSHRGDFSSNKVSINGTYETQELGRAYNLMLEGI